MTVPERADVKSRADAPILRSVYSARDRAEGIGPRGTWTGSAGTPWVVFRRAGWSVVRARPDPRLLPPHLSAPRGRWNAPSADVLRPRHRHRRPADPGRDLGEGGPRT